MANWAFTDYVIEGPKETLDKIFDALEHHPIAKDSSDNWEGNVLLALGISWEDYSFNKEGNVLKPSGYYLRGFIQHFEREKDTIVISAEEAWGLTDFYKLLMDNFPDVKVFYRVEEDGESIYDTNDVEGKYFPDRYYVDLCIDDAYESEYFIKEKEVYEWLSKLTKGKITDKDSVEAFNDEHEDAGDDYKNYINIYEFSVSK